MRRSFVPLFLLGMTLMPLGIESARAEKLDPNHPPANATPQEIKMGDEASVEFEKAKTTKIVDPNSSPENKALQDKLNGIIQKLGPVSGRPGIKYVVKIVENKDVNAFTLPNGKIYVFTGLLDMTASDDEIAAVLAHEIGHNTRLHALRGESKAKKLNWLNIAAMAAMVMGGGQGVGNVAAFSQYALLGVMNGYGVGYEKEADSTAVDMMQKAGYNPSGIVTFMRRLETEERTINSVPLGIFQTHPPSEERADATLAQMKREKIPFTPREVTGGATVQSAEKPDRITLSLGTYTVIELAKLNDKDKTRAQNMAENIQTAWHSDMRAYDLTATPDGRLMVRGVEVAKATSADAKLNGVATPGATANLWLKNFQKVFWREQLMGKV